jgi:hypothetical protein
MRQAPLGAMTPYDETAADYTTTSFTVVPHAGHDYMVMVTLKTPWRDGTTRTHLRFEPLTLLERLAALTPRPRINVLLYHAIQAPHATGRAAAVAYGRPAAIDRPPRHVVDAAPAAEAVPTPPASPDAAQPGVSPEAAAAPRVPHACAPESAEVPAPPAYPPAAAVRSPR